MKYVLMTAAGLPVEPPLIGFASTDMKGEF